jgi:hypothetical protein
MTIHELSSSFFNALFFHMKKNTCQCVSYIYIYNQLI